MDRHHENASQASNMGSEVPTDPQDAAKSPATNDRNDYDESDGPICEPSFGEAVKDHIFDMTVLSQHIRLGDILTINNRPCQVIRISSTALGRLKYLGVDLFNHELHEEVAAIHSPAPDVSLQTMRVPVMKQYRLLDIQEEHLICISETGSIRQNLPIIRSSNLVERIDEAFKSGHGSIQVLVVCNEDQELAVDMKVLHGAGAGSRQGTKFKLHALARDDDLSGLKNALMTGNVDVNEVDEDGKTALFHAVEQEHVAFAYTLIEAKANLDQEDKKGKTVLDVAVARVKPGSGMPALNLVETLLKRNASTTEDNQVAELLTASAYGKTQEVEAILKRYQSHPGRDWGSSVQQTALHEAADIDSQKVAFVNRTDRLGYTALHEAAIFGHDEVAKLLIERGADVKLRIAQGLGGDGVLHCVLERYTHRLHLRGGTHVADRPRYRGGHSRIVALLLHHNPSVRHQKRHDGRTVQDVLLEKLKLGDLSAAERYTLEQVLMILRSYAHGIPELTNLKTFTQLTRNFYDRSLHLEGNFHLLKVLCHKSSAIQHQEERCIGKILQNPEGIGFGGDTPRDGDWIWIHLPKTNKLWVEQAVGSRSNLSGHAWEVYLSGCKAFINDTYYDVQSPPHHPGMRKPSYSPFSREYDGVFALVIPYFYAESFQCRSESGCDDANCRSRRDGEQKIRSFYQTDGNVKNWHEPCPLDQSYYVFLEKNDSAGRNKDQVITKYLKRQESNSKANILMVNQMWIWKMDCGTIITAFPDGQQCSRVDGKQSLLGRLSQVIQQSPPSSMESLIVRLMQTAIELIDNPTNSGFNEDILDIFDRSIAFQKQDAMTCYDRFRKAQRQGRTEQPGESKPMQDLEDDMCNITAEMENLREIRDIQDELNMIERIFDGQESVVASFADAKRDLLKQDEDAIQTLERFFDFRISRVKHLLNEAHAVEASLNYLLDIKQKHGSLTVATNMRRLADQADQRARDGESQTQLLFIFTVITIIFTPVSLVFSFLAVPSRDFPNDGQGNIAWTWWQVFIGGLITEIATFAAIAAFWYFPNTSMLSLTFLSSGGSHQGNHSPGIASKDPQKPILPR